MALEWEPNFKLPVPATKITFQSAAISLQLGPVLSQHGRALIMECIVRSISLSIFKEVGSDTYPTEYFVHYQLDLNCIVWLKRPTNNRVRVDFVGSPPHPPMSELQRSFARSKLAMLPPEVPTTDPIGIPESRDEDNSSASSLSSTGTLVPSPTRHLFARTRNPQSTQSLDWTDFFDQELFLPQEGDKVHIIHHVYLTPPSHSGPLFVMHHGAGSSGLSFATCAGEIRKILPNAGVLSIDARGHGRTLMTANLADLDNQNPSIATAAQDEADGQIELDLSLQTLSKDLVHAIRKTQERMKWEQLPEIVLVGHSLGGAVITDVAKNGELGSKVLAHAVLDVVEGSAMDALQSMEKYLLTRPTRFPSLESGIEWHTRSRTIRNSASARASVPSLIYEEGHPADPSRPWVWRTNLSATKPFWENWFIGLSKKFLDARGGKLLLLAGTDRLDKELMIGQMQGKYQLQVFPEAGHFVQEDQPAKTAQVLADFYKRNDRSALVLPPKVADMQAAAAMKKGTGASINRQFK